MPGRLPAFDHAAEVAQPEHIEKNVQWAEMNEHRCEQPPDLAMSDFRQAKIRRQKIIAHQPLSDEQALDGFEVVSETGAEEHDNANGNQHERQRSETVNGKWPDDVPADAHSLA